MTRRILITIEYDGGPFSGWQRQDNADSVQARIEDAAAAFLFSIIFLAILKSAIHWVFMVFGTLGLIVFLMLSIKLYKRLREKYGLDND